MTGEYFLSFFSQQVLALDKPCQQRENSPRHRCYSGGPPTPRPHQDRLVEAPQLTALDLDAAFVGGGVSCNDVGGGCTV